MKRSQKLRRSLNPWKRAVTPSRQSRAAATQRLNPRGSIASIRARTVWPKTGAAPSVEMPTTSGERLTIAPNFTSQRCGRSTALTMAPAPRAAATKATQSASSSRAPMQKAAPQRSSGLQARACSTTCPSTISPGTASNSSLGSGA